MDDIDSTHTHGRFASDNESEFIVVHLETGMEVAVVNGSSRG